MKPKYKIGQWVRVMRKTRFEFPQHGEIGHRRIISKTYLTNPIEGVIVGATRKFIGIVHHGDYERQGHLEVEGSVLCWKIAVGYLNKPILAVDGDFETIDPQENIPWKECDNKRQSIEMKGIYGRNPEWFKRDEKGRFV
jgi:hypothetical protein